MIKFSKSTLPNVSKNKLLSLKFNLIDTYEPIVFNILELECKNEDVLSMVVPQYAYCSQMTWHLLYQFVVNTNRILVGINLLKLFNQCGWFSTSTKEFCFGN